VVHPGFENHAKAMRTGQETTHEARILNLCTCCCDICPRAVLSTPARARQRDGIVRVKSSSGGPRPHPHQRPDVAAKGISSLLNSTSPKLAADSGIKLRLSTAVFGIRPRTQFITSNPKRRSRLAVPCC